MRSLPTAALMIGAMSHAFGQDSWSGAANRRQVYAPLVSEIRVQASSELARTLVLVMPISLVTSEKDVLDGR